MRTRALAALLAGTTVAAACAGDGDLPVNLAVRAVAVDLAFANEDLVEPVAPEVIIQIIPAPPEVVSGAVPLIEFATPPPSEPPPVFEIEPPCPTAPPNRVPDEPASVNFRGRVAPGAYPKHNEGTFTISGGIVDLTLPYPFVTTDIYSAVREVAAPSPGDRVDDVLGDTEPQPEEPGSPILEWDVTNVITNDISVTSTYRYTGSAIALVQRITRDAAGEQVFVPTPAIDIMQLNEGIGHTWRSAGVDTARRVAMQVEGAVIDRKPVDLCGELVDAFQVETTETIVNLETGETSGTTEPNLNHIATQFGGTIIRSELHYTQTTRDPESGAPLQITFDFVTTFDAIDPEAVDS